MDRGEMLKLIKTALENADLLSWGAFQNDGPPTPNVIAFSTALIAALRASAAPEEGIKPHFYNPDYQAMGDCRVCGHDDPGMTLPQHQVVAPSPDSRKAEPVAWQKRPTFGDVREWTLTKYESQNFWREQGYEIRPLYAALTPATEDGGREIDADFARTLTDNAAYVRAIRASVIEECAKVAESLARFDRLSEKNYAKAIRALSSSPSVGTWTADHLRQIKAFASTINERNFLDIALHIERQADQALSISSANRVGEA